MSVNKTDLIKQLRERTGLGMLECKKLLEGADWDLDKAEEESRKQGAKAQGKVGGRTTTEGTIGTYIHHNGRLTAMVELRCNTDFNAKSDDFQQLAKDLATHVAAMNPIAVSRDEVPAEKIEKEKEIYTEQMRKEGKPDEMIEKIVEGKMKKFFEETVLLDQKFVKDDKKTVNELIQELIGRTKENIEVARFVRMEVGAGAETTE